MCSNSYVMRGEGYKLIIKNLSGSKEQKEASKAKESLTCLSDLTHDFSSKNRRSVLKVMPLG